MSIYPPLIIVHSFYILTSYVYMQHLGNLAIETDMMKLVESKSERSMGKNCVKKFVNSIIQDLGELK